MEASLITIANKKNVYEDFLENLKTQIDVEFELLTAFNYNAEFSSARKAYNQFAEKAKGKYLIFLHPDIRFLNEHALADILHWVEKIPSFGVVGIAGAVRSGQNSCDILTTIVHTPAKQPVGKKNCGIQKVQTLDECLFVVEKEYFFKHPFPDKDGWHLYAVEYCLQAIKDGKDNYVVPSDSWHLSDGRSLDPNYVIQISDLVKQEKNNFDLICTTIKPWKTKGISAWLYRKYYFVKQCIKKTIVNR